MLEPTNDEPPSFKTIVEADAVTYRLPRRGRFLLAGGLIFAWLVGLALSTVWTAGLSAIPFSSSRSLTTPELVIAAIIGLIWSVFFVAGVKLLIAALALGFGWCVLTVADGELRRTERLGALRWTRRRAVSRITRLEIAGLNSSAKTSGGRWRCSSRSTSPRANHVGRSGSFGRTPGRCSGRWPTSSRSPARHRHRGWATMARRRRWSSWGKPNRGKPCATTRRSSSRPSPPARPRSSPSSATA